MFFTWVGSQLLLESSRDSCWIPHLQHLHKWAGWWHWKHPHQAGWWHQPGWWGTCQSGKPPYRENWTGCESRLARPVWGLTTISAKFHAWDGVTEETSTFPTSLGSIDLSHHLWQGQCFCLIKTSHVLFLLLRHCEIQPKVLGNMVDDGLQGRFSAAVNPRRKWDGGGGWKKLNMKSLTSPFKKQ